MEIQRNTGVKIPVGFRFCPTDEELIIHYLKRKVYSLQLPADVIPELDVFQTNPSDLPGESWEKRYFFSRRTMNLNKCTSGYWKVIGKDKKIEAPGNKQTIGVKKSLVYYKGNSTKTSWAMHQYSLLITPFSTQKITLPVGEWVVCCVFRRKKKRPSMNLTNNISQTASPSCSSGITTEIS